MEFWEIFNFFCEFVMMFNVQSLFYLCPPNTNFYQTSLFFIIMLWILQKKTNKLSVARCFSMYTMFLLCFVISHFVLCWKILSSLLVCLIRTHKSSFFLYFYYASTLSMAMGSGVEREKSISNASQCDGCNFFFNAVTRIEFLSSFSSLSYISFRKLNWIVFGKKSSYIST
jgi:hypothetical protein